jgi:hypothetical protein
MPITLLDDTQWQKGCGSLCGSWGITTKNNGVIWLHTSWLKTPTTVAVVLSHEITHIQYGDPTFPRLRRSFISNVFWRTEEEDVHMRIAPLVSSLVKQHPELSPLYEPCLTPLSDFWPMGVVLFAGAGAVGLLLPKLRARPA